MDELLQRITLLPQDYLAFVNSDFAESLAEMTATQYALNAAQEKILQDGFYFFLLFYLKKEQLIEYLATEGVIDREAAAEITDLLMAVLPDNFPTDLALETAPLPQPVTLEQIRTMSSDIAQSESQPSHTSSQDDILENQSPFDQPRPTPRWESEE